MNKRLETWKVIAAWLNMSPRKVREKASRRTPAEFRIHTYRLTTAPTAPVCADTDDLDAWKAKMRDATSNGGVRAQAAATTSRAGAGNV